MTEWIDVRDKLPRLHEWKLVTTVGGNVDISRLHHEAHWICADQVTHWAPLPEAAPPSQPRGPFTLWNIGFGMSAITSCAIMINGVVHKFPMTREGLKMHIDYLNKIWAKEFK